MILYNLVILIDLGWMSYSIFYIVIILKCFIYNKVALVNVAVYIWSFLGVKHVVCLKMP